MIWKPSKYNDETKKHIDPHFCSRECRYFQADLLSAVQGVRRESQKWFGWPVESATKWDCLSRISNANEFSPLISALGMAVATFYHNVEFFLKVRDMTPSVLDRLQLALVEHHAKHGGRCEIRFGVYNDGSPDYLQRGKLFLDFSLPNLHVALGSACRAIQAVFGQRQRPSVTMHPGKTVVSDETTLKEYVRPYIHLVSDANL